MSVITVVERPDDRGCAPPRGLFRHRDFVEAHRGRAGHPRWLHLGPFRCGRTIGLPIGIEERSANLSFGASFTDLELPSLTLAENLALAAALVAWLKASDLETAHITLPPRIYGDWIAPLSFALRASGWRSTDLRYSPLIPLDREAPLTGWNTNLRRGVARLRAEGARLIPDAAEEAMAWLESCYTSRGRTMSEGAQALLDYRARDLPLICFDIHRGSVRIAVIVLYRFGDIALYTFAGRDPECGASAFAWLVWKLAHDELVPGLEWLDLGAAGYARPGFDFVGNGVIRFKEQFRPVFDARETLEWTAA